MRLHPIDTLALLSQMAGLGILAGDSTFQSSITTLAGPFAPKIIAGLGLLALVASTILRIYGSPTSSSKGDSSNAQKSD